MRCGIEAAAKSIAEHLQCVALQSGVVKDIEASPVPKSYVESVAQTQSFDYVKIVFADRIVQSRVSVLVLEIHIAPVMQEDPYARGVLLVYCYV